MNVPDQQALSWNTHAILTRASAALFRFPFLSKSVPVAPLEEFLSRARNELPGIEKWHNELLAAKSGAHPALEADGNGTWSTETDFLTGFRLNPYYRIDYVRVLHPGEITQETSYNPSREGPPGNAYVDVELYEPVSALDVLATFSDEPDWGIDQELFSIEQYGYGPPPFGPRNGISSQAPFHMAFFHEHPLLWWFVPWLRKSFVEERVKVFFRLAGLAFEKDVPYWGWRFTAWALHYLQDLTQPYHATPFPLSRLKLVGRFLRDRQPRGFIGRNSNCLVNHHILFEAAVHFILNQAVKDDPDHAFLKALASSREISPTSLIALLHEASRTAAGVAQRVDRINVRLFEHPRLDDPYYILGEDPGFYINESLPLAVVARPAIFVTFSDLVRECLVHTGSVTRGVIDITAARIDGRGGFSY